MARRDHTIALARLVSTLLTLATASTTATAEGAHQHGVARLEVVVEGDGLRVTLDSPLDNLLGFERGPRTDAERAAVRTLAQRLRTTGALVQPAADAGCKLQGVDLASDVIAPALLGAAPVTAAAAAAPAGSGHADLEAVFRFRCAQPQALRSVALGGLFQAFPRLRQLDAAVAAPGVQRGARLRAEQSRLTW